MQDIQPLFETIRESCSPALWSRAVELNRRGTIVGVRSDGESVDLEVSPPGEVTSRKVTLYIEDEDWACDCRSGEDVCPHVAAAMIALKQARQSGKRMPDAPSVWRIRYLFTRSGGALHFGRAFVRDDEVQAFEATLAAIQSGRVRGPQFLASDADLRADLVLGMRTGGQLSRETLARLFTPLAECSDVLLDGKPVRVSADPVGLQIVVEDQGAGYHVSLHQDASISELFGNGVALCGQTLHPVGEPKLTGRELAEYRRGLPFPAERKVELFTKILPDLRNRIRVEVKTRRVPTQVEARPRIQLRVEREGDTLSVLPLLVYGDPPVARVDSGTLVLLGDQLPERDEYGEKRLARQLEVDLGLVPGHREHFAGERGVVFADKLERWRRGARTALIAGDAHHQFHLAPPIEAFLRVDGNDFDLRFDSIGDEGSEHGVGDGGQRKGQASPTAVLRAWRAGESLVPLIDGGFAPLPRDWMDRHGHLIADLLAAKEAANGELPASALPDLAKLCEALGEPPPPAFEALRPLIQDFQSLPSASVPADVTAELRAYQREGVDWLHFLRRTRMGALLADDMGLGKTLQAICSLEGPALVVAPTSVLFNWQSELSRFRPGLKVSLYHGPNRAIDPDADVTITSYALLRLDADALTSKRWKTVVLDEAQAIKNPDSQVARAAFRIRAEFRITLTGTPVENRLDELWSQFHFLNPGLLGARRDFEERYAKPIGAGDMDVTRRLRERIRPFVLRRLKREVAPELPPRTDRVLQCELTPEERGLYDAVLAATRDEVVERLRSGGSVLAALEALLRLRQASCHPALLPGQEAETSSKIELLMETLGEAATDGHKSLVFSQWTSLLDLIEPHLEAAGIRYARLDGTTRDRGAVVTEFQSDDGPPVLLLSLKAGGAGLNLTAADHVFLLDPWWNPAVEEQAADRAHRIGQERPVLVHRLVAIGTVEERILALQENKRALAEAALSGAQAAGSLTREDLLALLE